MRGCCVAVQLGATGSAAGDVVRGLVLAGGAGERLVVLRAPEQPSLARGRYSVAAIAADAVESVEVAAEGAVWAVALRAALAALPVPAASDAASGGSAGLKMPPDPARLAAALALLAERRIPAAERPDGVIAVLGGLLTVAPPYDAASCTSANEIVLQRIRAVLVPPVAAPIAAALDAAPALTAGPAQVAVACARCAAVGAPSEVASTMHYDFGVFYCGACWVAFDVGEVVGASAAAPAE